ncbi:Do family serine endopeptidase [Alkalisalibacterium limincola]|uniref:Do family serine endopeptidase n=1 Tax=Alkalisalibacterium limincola TaxID=2699169 RepID=A0A5C8KJB9_9GAMM|nr:Do family serine endopeptidase [Alkalisalibacterium limincola]TXK59797.1 Do family serine endopeptidase [Alkalisalibacterium limincola]
MRVLALLLLCLPLSAAALPPSDGEGRELPSLAPMLERVTPAVVNVQSQRVVQARHPLADDPFMRRFFGLPDLPRERTQQSLGSGVIVDAAQGLVLTNHHVVEAADGIAVTLADGRTLDGELVGADPDTDVAVIRIPASGLQALRLADMSRLQVGDFVVAVGNPFGLGQTVTSGIVSALGRTGLHGLGYQNFIQTDASINPGNSGGALVNLRGELVGINTAIFSPSGGNIGIGFAIPSDLAQEVMGQLLAHGEVRRGSIGVEAQDITPGIARSLGLDSRRGALVARVYPDTPAARAGVRSGDVIVDIDGRRIDNAQALSNLEGLLPVGRALPLTLRRDGSGHVVDITLSARPSLNGNLLGRGFQGAMLGEPGDRQRARGVRGVLVNEVAPNSPAFSRGLRPGDLILAVGPREVDGLQALEAAVAATPGQLSLNVLRGRRQGVLILE